MEERLTKENIEELIDVIAKTMILTMAKKIIEEEEKKGGLI